MKKNKLYGVVLSFIVSGACFSDNLIVNNGTDKSYNKITIFFNQTDLKMHALDNTKYCEELFENDNFYSRDQIQYVFSRRYIEAINYASSFQLSIEIKLTLSDGIDIDRKKTFSYDINNPLDTFLCNPIINIIDYRNNLFDFTIEFEKPTIMSSK